MYQSNNWGWRENTVFSCLQQIHNPSPDKPLVWSSRTAFNAIKIYTVSLFCDMTGTCKVNKRSTMSVVSHDMLTLMWWAQMHQVLLVLYKKNYKMFFNSTRVLSIWKHHPPYKRKFNAYGYTASALFVFVQFSLVQYGIIVICRPLYSAVIRNVQINSLGIYLWKWIRSERLTLVDTWYYIFLQKPQTNYCLSCSFQWDGLFAL